MDSLRCRTAWYGRQVKVHSHLNSAINLRKSKKPAPKLNENQILSITVDGEVFQGIKLDVVFMWSFWSRIGSIGEIIPIDKEVRGALTAHRVLTHSRNPAIGSKWI